MSGQISISLVTVCVVTFASAAIQKLPTQAPISNLQYSSDVNLTFIISARDLPNTGIVANIDPYIKLYSSDSANDAPQKFATSDVVSDSANPDFNQVFSFVWKRGTGQKITFKVKDKGTVTDGDIGQAIMDVDSYVFQKEKMNITISAGGNKAAGQLFIQKSTPVKFRLYARGLPRLDFNKGKSDGYVTIYWKRGSHGEEHKLGKTAHIDDNDNPDWTETFEFPNYVKGTDLWWRFEVKDHDGLTSSDHIGDADVEIDPFVEKRQTKIVKIEKKGSATLGITPAY